MAMGVQPVDEFERCLGEAVWVICRQLNYGDMLRIYKKQDYGLIVQGKALATHMTSILLAGLGL
jgi:hypothetical protein